MSEENSLVIKITSERAEKNVRDLIESLARLEDQGEDTSGALEDLGEKSNKSTKGVGDLSGKVKTLAASMAGLISVGQAISAADEFTQMAARVRNATTSLAEYEMVQNSLQKTANNTFRSFKEAQEVFLSMNGGMKSLGYSTQQAIAASDSLSYSFVMNATRADQAQSAQDALSKAMAKGKVDADAWISIVTGADNIIADMAKTTGMTEQEIRQLGATGKVSLQDLLQTLIQTRDANEELAGSMENSAKDGWQYLINNVTIAVGKMNMATGATATLADGFKFLGDNVGLAATAGGVAASIYAGRVVGSLYTTATAAVAAQRATVTLTGAMGAATATSKAFLVAIGGPLGMAVALASVAAGVIYFNKKLNETRDTLGRTKKSIQELTQEYLKLDDAQRKVTLFQEKKELGNLHESYERLGATLVNFSTKLTAQIKIGSESRSEIRRLKEEFMSGSISVAEFAEKVGKVNGVTEEEAAYLAKLGIEMRSTEKAIRNQKELVDQLSKAKSENVKQTQQLTIEQQKLNAIMDSDNYKKLQEQTKLAQETQKLINQGMSTRQASFLAGSASSLGLDYTTAPKEIKDTLNASWAAQERLNKAAEKESQIRRETLKTGKQKVEFQQKELEMLRRVQTISTKNGLDEIGAAHGIPKGLLAAIMAQESGGNINAKSSTGAIGPFQTTSIYRKEMGLSVADSYDVKKVAEAAAKFIADRFKEFGNWEDAVTAYNAGAGGTRQLRKTGFTQSAAKTKEASEYAPKVFRWLDGLGGDVGARDSVDSIQDVNEYLKAIEVKKKADEELAKARADLDKEYLTAAEVRQKDHEERLKKIGELYADEAVSADRKRLEEQEKNNFKATEEYIKAREELELNQHKMTEDKLIEARADLSKKELAAAKDFSDEYKKLMFKTIDEISAKEIGEFRKAQREKLDQIKTGYQNYLGRIQDDLDDDRARRTMSSKQYAEYSLNRDSAQAQAAISQEQWDAQGKLEAAGYLPNSEEYLEAYDAFEQAKYDIAEEYEQKTAEMRREYRIAEYQGYAGLFGDIASMVKLSGDDNSKYYKGLIVAQRAMTLTSVALSSYKAIADAYATGGSFPMNLISAARVASETGLIQAAVAAIQPPTGMAHNGIDNIPKEGTWLLDGGERVLNPQQNKDLTQYIQDQRNSQQAQQQQYGGQLNLKVGASLEEGALNNYMNSPSFEQTLMIKLGENASEIRSMLQI